VGAAGEAGRSSNRKCIAAASSHVITPTTLFRVLLGCILLLLGAEVFRQVASYGFGHDYARFSRLFDLDAERNVPTWFSTVQLFLASMLAFMIYLDRRPDGTRLVAHWAGLGFIMLYISLDEAVALHEQMILPLREFLDLGGILYFSWVIVGALAVVAVVLIYVPFLKSLPKRTAILIFLAGTIYVGGALGLELVGGAIADKGEQPSLLYDIVAAMEESLEMIGIATFVFALADYASRHCKRIGPVFGGSDTPGS